MKKLTDLDQASDPISEYISTIPKFTQTQRSLTDQLQLLSAVAVKLGLYDADDFIKRTLTNTTKGPSNFVVKDNTHESFPRGFLDRDDEAYGL